jgi:type I restriction enzyme R subunit
MHLLEAHVEEAALAWWVTPAFSVAHGAEIAVGQASAERSDPNYRDVVLECRLRPTTIRLKPDLPKETLDDTFRKMLPADGTSLIERNRAAHKMLVNGVTVEYHQPGEPIKRARSTSTIRTRTTGWRSTSSRWLGRRGITGGRTS